MTITAVVAAFTRAWNTDDAGERLQQLAESCVPDAVFVAPQGATAGIAGLSEGIGEFRRAFPAAAVSFGEADEHGGFARVSWRTRWNDGRPDLAGEDFAQLAGDGRIKLLVSFDGAPQPVS